MEGGTDHSRLLTLTTLQLPQKPRRAVVVRFGCREERNRFLDCLRKCLAELLQVELPPSSSVDGEEGEEEGEGRAEEEGREGEGMSAALALLRERAVALPSGANDGGKEDETGEERREKGGSMYVPLTEAATLLVAERKETRRIFSLLLDTEMDTSALEDENAMMRRDVTRLQTALAEREDALAKALANVHDNLKERFALARKVDSLEMDNADLRQIMEKTDMAQAAQHQEEQRHGQLQLEMQVQANMDLVEKMVDVQKENHELKEKLQRLSEMMHAREDEIARVLHNRASSPSSPNGSDYPSLSSLPPMPSSSPPPPPVVASPEKKKKTDRGNLIK